MSILFNYLNILYHNVYQINIPQIPKNFPENLFLGFYPFLPFIDFFPKIFFTYMGGKIYSYFI